jgi:hypothetical protein
MKHNTFFRKYWSKLDADERREFRRECGIPTGTLAPILTGDRGIGPKTACKMTAYDPDLTLSRIWDHLDWPPHIA